MTVNWIIRPLAAEEITRELFHYFSRRQDVKQCWRKVDGQWCIRDVAFVDNWSEDDYAFLVRVLKETIADGGLVCAAFVNGQLKGFAAVLAQPFGSRRQYRDLASLHVSEDMRRHGMGKALIHSAAAWAQQQGAEKLYISAHSAVGSQAFYRAMGCVDAEEINAAHAEAEPCDCQMECLLKALYER